MGIKALLSKPISKFLIGTVDKWASKPVETQQKVLEDLIAQAKHTVFGKDHNFDSITDYNTFKQNVPLMTLALPLPSMLPQHLHSHAQPEKGLKMVLRSAPQRERERERELDRFGAVFDLLGIVCADFLLCFFLARGFLVKSRFGMFDWFWGSPILMGRI